VVSTLIGLYNHEQAGEWAHATATDAHGAVDPICEASLGTQLVSTLAAEVGGVDRGLIVFFSKRVSHCGRAPKSTRGD